MPTPSFSHVGALLLKIRAFFCTAASFFGTQILWLAMKYEGDGGAAAVIAVQSERQKNGNGAQKDARIFISNAPTWLKLGVVRA